MACARLFIHFQLKRDGIGRNCRVISQPRLLDSYRHHWEYSARHRSHFFIARTGSDSFLEDLFLTALRERTLCSQGINIPGDSRRKMGVVKPKGPHP
ncbi:hypothetical protein NPIL_197021 [Nephila pilipes]|uniref:Uncharacterized protein n=1 Tax=Nephila pilipes TaxID=299642 RepID=A0A8X6U256_NEPPI|nr:hypothetical protein NPIL_197021 [Nephila pilipes]